MLAWKPPGPHLPGTSLSQVLTLLRLDKAGLRKSHYAGQRLLQMAVGKEQAGSFLRPALPSSLLPCCNALLEGSLYRFGPVIAAQICGLPCPELKGEPVQGRPQAAGGGGRPTASAGRAPLAAPTKSAGLWHPTMASDRMQGLQERHWPPASLALRTSNRSPREDLEQTLSCLLGHT